jgi:hypothetical protein
MTESRDILTLEVDFEDYPDWVEDNRLLFLRETITASEEMVHDDLDLIHIMTINVRSDIGGMKVVCNLNREDLVESLEKVLEKCVESEEYELAQRVKNLQDYINEHNL